MSKRQGCQPVDYDERLIGYLQILNVCYTIYIERHSRLRKDGIMETIQITKNAYPINDAMNVLFSKLDEAIDDMEAGRVISEEELWAEIDAI